MTGPVFVWDDGAPIDSQAVQDRGLHYGDGLFETLSVRDGRARFLELHLDRLFGGAARLELALAPRSICESELRAAAQQLGDGVLKYLVTRGAQRERGYAPPIQAARRVLLAYGSGGNRLVAANVWCCDLRLAEQPALAGIKHLNRLEQVLAAAECRAAAERLAMDIHEGILCSANGTVVCGVSGNLFWYDGKVLHTPRIDRCGVAGVMRRIVMREAATLGIAVIEQAVAIEPVLQAKEIFMTNARWPLLPAKMVVTGGGTERPQYAASGYIAQLLGERIAGLER